MKKTIKLENENAFLECNLKKHHCHFNQVLFMVGTFLEKGLCKNLKRKESEITRPSKRVFTIFGLRKRSRDKGRLGRNSS